MFVTIVIVERDDCWLPNVVLFDLDSQTNTYWTAGPAASEADYIGIMSWRGSLTQAELDLVKEIMNQLQQGVLNGTISRPDYQVLWDYLLGILDANGWRYRGSPNPSIGGGIIWGEVDPTIRTGPPPILTPRPPGYSGPPIVPVQPVVPGGVPKPGIFDKMPLLVLPPPELLPPGPQPPSPPIPSWVLIPIGLIPIIGGPLWLVGELINAADDISQTMPKPPGPIVYKPLPPTPEWYDQLPLPPIPPGINVLPGTDPPLIPPYPVLK
jgi:hypothetical protein